MIYARHLDFELQQHFSKYNQALILLGPRQCGKTTILKRIFPHAKYLLLDNAPILEAIETYDQNVYKQLWSQENCIILDELHLISDPGRAVKIFYDEIPNLKIVVTGSSSLDIKNKTTESMAGRKIDYHLFPLTFSEYLYQKSIVPELDFRIFKNIFYPSSTLHLFNVSQTLEYVLIYGLYPEMIRLPQDQKYLKNLVDSVIFKDILELQLIEDRRLALNLLKLLAYQIGNLINYTEIANRLSANIRTVQKYIEIFEQSFLIFRIYPFSKNKRDEIGKKPKLYFNDTGLRNALIQNFDPLDIRPDRGALFENFIFSECMKANSYLDKGYNFHYWRLKSGSEIDMVLSKGDELIGVELKFSKSSLSGSFKARYPEAITRMITAKNFY